MILDACCGGKSMYHSLNNQFTQDEIVYIDIRKGTFTCPYKGTIAAVIKPTILADCKHLPFRDNTFRLIIFDPPHLSTLWKSDLEARYGSIDVANFRLMLRAVNEEFYRVLKIQGILLTKTLDRQRRSSYMRPFLSNFKCLLDIDYRSKGKENTSQNTTHWHVFIKKTSVPLESQLGIEPQDYSTLKPPQQLTLQAASESATVQS